MKNVVLIIIFFGSLFKLFSQNYQPISMDDILDKVVDGNHAVLISEQEVMAAKGDYNQTNAIWVPQISISHTGFATTNPLMAFGSKLNQEILTQADFNPDLLNNPSQIKDYSTRVAVQQPLVNINGLYHRKAAKAKLEAVSLQSARQKEYIRLVVYQNYMQLQLAYKTVAVLNTSREVAIAHRRLAQNRFKQGFLQKSDVLAIEIRVSELNNQLQSAKSNIQNTSNQLSVLIGEGSHKLLRPTDSLTVVSGFAPSDSLPRNRKDILAISTISESHKQLFQADKMSFLPSLNAFATYELHDDTVFQGGANGYIVGAELKWNILEGAKRFGKLQKSRAVYEKSKLELDRYKAESQVAMRRAKRTLIDAQNSLELTVMALEHSRESLRIRANRFAQGLELTTDLLRAEAQFAQKQLAYYATIFQHNYALAYLQFLTKE